MYDVINILEERGKQRLILLIDFEKAFDSTDFLKAYNFERGFIKWFKILYRDSYSCFIKHWIPFRTVRIGKGLQTRSVSSCIFILIIEPLAVTLKNNNIHSVK